MRETVECGDLVIDQVTNVEGIVSSVSDYLSGYQRINIQPQIEKGSGKDAPKAFNTDTEQVQIIKKGVVKATPVTYKGPEINLGDSGKDKITPVKGIVAIKAVSISGCLTVYLQDVEKLDKKGRPFLANGIDADRFVPKEKAKVEEKPPKERTGPRSIGLNILP